MDIEKIDLYAACDRAIKAMDREIVEAFGRLKMMKFDELNIISTVTEVYRRSASKAHRRYRDIGLEVYLLIYLLYEEDRETARKMAEKAITDKWVEERLREPDPVTMYRFDTETERKAYRLAEALETGVNRDQEINRALRAWSKQLGQYAINFTDQAMIQAFKDAEIRKVMWISQRDGRVCDECHELDGQVFRIDELPPKHWGCRCRLKPVSGKEQKTD